MAKPSTLSLGGRKIVHFFPDRPKNTRDDQLGNPISIPDRKRLFPKIDQKHANLATVIGIDRSRSVHHPDSFLNGEAAAGSDLALKAFGNGHGNSRRDQSLVPRAQGVISFSKEAKRSIPEAPGVMYWGRMASRSFLKRLI